MSANSFGRKDIDDRLWKAKQFWWDRSQAQQPLDTNVLPGKAPLQGAVRCPVASRPRPSTHAGRRREVLKI